MHRPVRHENLSVKSLDWFDALAQDGVHNVQATLNNMRPELVLGADIVSNLLLLFSRTLLKPHPHTVVSSRHDCSVSCYPQYRTAGIEISGISSRWNSISRAHSPQCRSAELISPGIMWVNVLRHACCRSGDLRF